MWTRLLLICTLLLGAGGFQDAIASHFAAGDLYVTYIGNGPTNLKYRVTLYTYVACEPSQAALYTSETVSWSSSCGGGGSRTITITPNAYSTQGGDTLDQLCPGFTAVNSCRSGNTAYPGFVRGTFEDTVTLPFACSDWKFYWDDGSRNSFILNMTGSSGYNIYLDATLDNTGTHWGNSTPRFLVTPIPYLCVNQDDKFVNGPYDPDIDSLVTSAAYPRNTGGTNILYTGIYSLTNVFGSAINYTGYTGPYIVNPTSGTAYFHPTQIGKYVIAYKVFDYDKYTGALIGYTTRDVQVSVLACSTTPPNMDTVQNSVVGGSYTISGASGNMITVCPGAPLTFNVHATAQVTTANVFLTANNGTTAPGSTLTVAGQGTSNPIGTFTWTPTGADIGPHTILFLGKDSTCNPGQPIVLYNYYIVTINVLPGIDAGPDGHYCPGGTVNSNPWQINVTGPPGINYLWSAIPGGSGLSSLSCVSCPNPLSDPLVSTTYIVTSTAPQVACKNSDTITVNVHPYTSVDAGAAQTICANQSVTLNPIVSPSTGATWYWTPGSSLTDSTIFNAVAHPYSTTSYVFHLTDLNGCKYDRTTQVIVNGVAPIVNAYTSRDTVCPAGSVDLFSTISQQPCGLAQMACQGNSTNNFVGTDPSSSTFPTPFYNYQYGMGEKTQLIYSKDDLDAAGIKAGFINNLALNIASKGSTDSFRNFTIKMACTGMSDFGNYNYGVAGYYNFPGSAVVFSKSIKTSVGWNQFDFGTPYYWDGQGSLVVEICYSRQYLFNGGGPDAVYVSSTPYTSVLYYPYGQYNQDGCSVNYNYLSTSNARPNTRFNVCTSNNYNYSWTPSGGLTNPNSPNTTANNITNPTTFTINVTAASNPACVGTASVSVGVDNSNSVDALVNGQTSNPYILCRPGYVQLEATGIGAPPATNLPCGTAGTITCTTPDVTIVNSSFAPGNANYNSTTPYGYAVTGKGQYIVRHGDMNGSGMRSGSLKSIEFYVPSINYSYATQFVGFEIALGCTQKNSFDSPNDFITAVTPVYNGTANLVVGWNTYVFNTPYNWDTTQNLVVQVCYAGNAYPYYGVQTVGTLSKNYAASIHAYDYSGNACTNGSPYSYMESKIPMMRFSYCPSPAGNFAYAWDPGQYVSDSAIANPLAYIDSSVTYRVFTQGLNGCRVKDSVQIIVPIHNVSVTPADTAICIGQSVQLHASGGTTYQWYENGFSPATSLDNPTSASPIASPTQDVVYTVVFSDQYSCPDTMYVSLHVWPLPVVNIINKDTTIKYGQHVNLMATGANFYTWTPVGSLSNPNLPNPVASPTASTTYILFGDDNNHCRSTDTVRINVDMRDNLMVPSAFTPNGDGKNDVFRVANLTFQRLMEFRVFNRWGQEVFATTDVTKGWDGKWKGVMQDMGNYQYIIRVAFPDGFVETYKGDVTLVR
jgi:gliding motility-associated-like protein